MHCSDLRFSCFGNAEDVGHAEVLQDFALHAGLEWSDVEPCSTPLVDQHTLLPRDTTATRGGPGRISCASLRISYFQSVRFGT